MSSNFSIKDPDGNHTIVGTAWCGPNHSKKFTWHSGSYRKLFRNNPLWIYKDETDEWTIKKFIEYLKDREEE